MAVQKRFFQQPRSSKTVWRRSPLNAAQHLHLHRFSARDGGVTQSHKQLFPFDVDGAQQQQNSVDKSNDATMSCLNQDFICVSRSCSYFSCKTAAYNKEKEGVKRRGS